MEKATSLQPLPRVACSDASPAMEKFPTPGRSTCEAVAELLNVPLATTVKSLVLATDVLGKDGGVVQTQVWLLLIRGNDAMNEVKVGKIEGLANFRFATEDEIVSHFGCKPGYLGPIDLVAGTAVPVKIVADREVAAMSNWICGANAVDFHIKNVNWGRDLPEPDLVADIRNVVTGDASPDGKGILAIERGIEVGHVFYLGTKYSKAMEAKFLDMDGKPKHFEMGCYGIGITRLPAAAIEQNHDERGIIWPDAIAPFTLVICTIDYAKDAVVKTRADALYESLKARGVDVILDDRGERPGIMFAEWELIGVPHRVVISSRGLKEGTVEYQHRKETAATKMAEAELDAFLAVRVK